MEPQGPEMDDILVATVARPQDVDSDERLRERQQQMPSPNQRRPRWFAKIRHTEIVVIVIWWKSSCPMSERGQSGCNSSAIRVPDGYLGRRGAIGAVKLQSVTSGCCTVTAAV